MQIVEPGHIYDLAWYDGDAQRPFESLLIFMKREGAGYPGNVGHHPGTNIQDVLRALLDRVKYLDAQIPDVRNTSVVMLLRTAIGLLEERAAERHGRLATWPPLPYLAIEAYPTCAICGHIGCAGTCR